MFLEGDTSPAVCVTLTDVMAGLDREVNVSVEVMDGSATEGMYNIMYENFAISCGNLSWSIAPQDSWNLFTVS